MQIVMNNTGVMHVGDQFGQCAGSCADSAPAVRAQSDLLAVPLITSLRRSKSEGDGPFNPSAPPRRQHGRTSHPARLETLRNAKFPLCAGNSDTADPSSDYRFAMEMLEIYFAPSHRSAIDGSRRVMFDALQCLAKPIQLGYGAREHRRCGGVHKMHVADNNRCCDIIL